MTAEDVKFSFERFLPGPDGKKVDYADDWAALEKVEVTGPLSGKIHLKSPSPAVWLIALADGSGVIISKKAFEKLGEKFRTTAIGSGPYILKEWVPRDHFTLVANPDYLGEKPFFTEIVGKPIADEKTAQLALQAGEIDFARIDPGIAKEIENAPGIKTREAVGDRLCVDRPQHREETIRRPAGAPSGTQGARHPGNPRCGV